MAAIHRRVAYLQRNGATSATPISSINKGDKWQQIYGYEIKAAIRTIVCAAGPAIRFTKADISARSLCAWGGMALIMARVDPYTICLVGRRQSNTMLRCLHTTEKSFTEALSTKMFEHGTYVLIHPAHTGS